MADSRIQNLTEDTALVGTDWLVVEVGDSEARKVSVATLQTAIAGYVLLSDTTLGIDTASFDITGISQAYKHLNVILSARGTQAVTLVVAQIRFNNDSGANYDYAYMGVGTFDAETSGSIGDAPGASAPSGSASAHTCIIPNYAGTTFQKAFTSTYGAFGSDTAGGNWSSTHVGARWRSTAAINRITIFPNAGNWLTGSRLTIYGLG